MLDSVRARSPLGSHAGGPAAPTLHAALTAVSSFAARCPRTPGSIAGFVLPADVRQAWLVGLRGALNEIPVLPMGVTAGGISGSGGIELGGDSPIPGRLVDAGVTRITVWRGATDRELLALAQLLTTAWEGGDEGALDAEVWAASYEHVVIERRRDERAAPDERILMLPTEGERLSEDALRVLRELRDTAAPAPGALMEVHATTRALPAELAAEVQALASGGDLAPGALGVVLRAAGEQAERVVPVAIDAFAAGQEVGAIFHPFLEQGERVEGLIGLGHRLAAALPPEETPEARGGLFSMFQLLPINANVGALAEALPHWAVVVLADVLLVREILAGAERSAMTRLREEARGELYIGLAMATRLDDPRLTDRVLALVDHPAPEVRVNALVSLRMQSNPRVHQRVVRALEDGAMAVRIEALRYAVAHRLASAVPWLEHAVVEGLAGREDVEVRAMCVALGKLGRERSESILLGLVQRRAPGARFAAHGLKAAGGPNVRTNLEMLLAEDPSLRSDVAPLLADVM